WRNIFKRLMADPIQYLREFINEKGQKAAFLQTKGCLDGKFGRKEMKEYAPQWPALLRCTIFSELAIRELCPKASLTKSI
ncbi:MAG: hypothetical protein ACP5GD_03595, partial [Candidatus Micrarchaeia archaeon]